MPPGSWLSHSIKEAAPLGSPFMVERELWQRELIGPGEREILTRLRTLRNQASHMQSFQITEHEAAAYIDTALSLTARPQLSERTTMTTTTDIVAKLWGLCNVLRDDGVTYNEYVTELDLSAVPEDARGGTRPKRPCCARTACRTAIDGDILAKREGHGTARLL